MPDKKSMESIDFSCFCSMLREHFHWTWRTPGGGKMDAPRGLLPVATYSTKASADFASGVRPKALARTDAGATPSSRHLAAIP